MSSALSLQPAPLTSAVFSRTVEEDLESQARASLSLFGFGSKDSVNWSPVSATATTASSADTTGTGGAIKVRVMERVCPVGTNKFLWNTMNSLANGGEGGDDPEDLCADPATINGNNSNGVNVNGARDGEKLDWDSASSNAGLGNMFASKVLQQYLVKCVALLPSSIEEVVDLLIRSDREDMELPMQHLVGVRTSSSAFVYRRKKKPRRRSNNNMSSGISGSSSDGVSQRMTSQASTQDCDSESSYSDSDLDVDEDVHPFTGFGRESTSGRARGTRGESSEIDRSRGNATPTGGTSPGLYLSNSYMEDYRTAMATSGHQGNLGIKWVIGEKSSRMFASRTTYCLLDYECILVNDWDEDADPSPMYVRTMQSCYSPQCQSWLDEVGSKPTDLQPTGFMVRLASGHNGYVEIQFVASILEKAQLPLVSRRAKLRALCAKIARLEEVLTSRRLSQSLLVNAPHWVHNRERLGCRICNARFGLSRRRHHCRLCGEVCCSECCPKMDVALPDVGSTSVRVCIVCIQKRRKICESTTSSSSASAGASSPSPSKEATHNPPPPLSHPFRSVSSSPPNACLPSSSSHSSAASSFTTASSLGEQKHSLASSVFQKMKSSSLS
ncbi:hypothetical protein F444_09357 [Plasmopara halstedii]|uniref:FYVE-type domain-containing protein n=1 Tax=Plasmopara halstedii TaxID=4781 RepID=A0A0P1A736_PLAHL|nr:hypothetical protein F444_09357 [Plasmopara halstedii]CEG36470.1 hypothetical protein F444_09357 [Plasmopara halstedii]|eukprot:XP_024572839.1 hypothetical protein F444_09357 [Plasmopara halstedii]